jgi:hypothetical protein
MVYLINKYIAEEDISELDQVNMIDIFGHDYWDIHDGNKEIIYINEDAYDWRGEAEPIKIDMLMEFLINLKNEGADYVEIMNNTDHHGYVITALNMRKATIKEAYDYRIQENQEVLDEKDNEIEYLEKKLDKLKKERDVSEK